MNHMLDGLETLLSFSKHCLFNTFSQNIDNCCEAFSLLFSMYDKTNSHACTGSYELWMPFPSGPDT